LWEWFIDLNSTRGGGFGHSPITYTEIKSWCDLTQTELTPWETGVLRRLDYKFLSAVSDLDKKRNKKKK
jgi:hypothetical protein